jgi:hypothetical protein
MFILIEGLNLFNANNLEDHFDGLVTVLEMVVAFYFGSRAVDVLRARRAATAPAVAQERAAQPEVRAEAPEKEIEVEEKDLPSERPVLASGLSEVRLINVAEAENKADTPQTMQAWHSKAELCERVLAMTASFETGQRFPDCFGAIAGNFDGQGISFGALQWNIGQGSLQPLWKSMYKQHEQTVREVMGPKFDEFINMLQQAKGKQLEWAKSIQYTDEARGRRVWRVVQDWKNRLQELGKTNEMIQLQVETAQVRYNIAIANCRQFELTTERGVALMFDINVQNGKVNRNGVGDRIFEDYLRIPSDHSDQEKQIEKMKVIAERRSAISHPRWREDVKNRKMTIALGEGTVHGRIYNLERDYKIALKPYV